MQSDQWLYIKVRELEESRRALRLALWAVFRALGGDTDGTSEPAGISDSDLVSAATEIAQEVRVGHAAESRRANRMAVALDKAEQRLAEVQHDLHRT